MKIGDLIRAARKSAGLTQVQLAELLEVNKSAVAQWELGNTLPTPRNIELLKAHTNFDAALETTASTPYRGKFVEEPHLLAWIDLLDIMDEADRVVLLRLARSLATGRKRA